ncbi:MAG: SEC-C domain-containing protein, partial [Eubacterium sp.]|nr:SEC-C domain-containing protein [Eubacterium sp.]
LHQAIEAKEGVKVKRESRTLATITFQNFFNKYKKKAGMTGTAMTEDKEFMDIYGMDVVEIPTNKPMIRVDKDDSIYMTKQAKLKAVINDIIEAHERMQPVLVGTINIDASEEISRLLSKKGIRHNVLNAKFHEMEAEIISHAGEKGAVTIATNMAGRGTDIKLEDGVAELGGLKIIGTERHESRRIDNQLRGRSGRQGDPGESKFYLSLEDDLMRLFGSERMMSIYKNLGIEEDEEIHHKTITRQIEKAQKKIENNNYGIRKNLLDYDQVNNDQREVIYAERRRVLDGESMRDVIYRMIRDVVKDEVDMVAGELPVRDWNLVELNESLRHKIPLKHIRFTDEEIENNDYQGVLERLQEEAMDIYHKKEQEFDAFKQGISPEELEEMDLEEEAIYNDGIREVERVILLKVIDRKWMNHIDDMDQLRQSIGLQSYAQKDPVVQYKFLGYDMFEEMTRNITHDTVTALMHVEIQHNVEREQVAKATGTNKDDSVAKGPYRRKQPKVGRNDPCPCGSGKKYKQCCGRFE